MAADKTGYRKRLMIPLMILATLFSGGSAFAGTFAAFLFLRLMVGIAEMPAFPLSMSFISAESKPEKLASNIGIVNIITMIVVLILGPVAITQLAVKFNWQYAFIISSLPGLINGDYLLDIFKRGRFGEGHGNSTQTKALLGRL